LRFERPKGIIKKYAMRKLFFTLMLTLPLSMVAQPHHHQGEKMSPEQQAVLKAKALRLQLDLTENQEGTVKNVLENQIQTKWKPTMKSFFTMLNTF
jgi:CHASE1-domain containing sensor protein